VVDVIRALTDSNAPRTYWGMLKQRLATDEGFIEVFTKCEQLKMLAPDGKMRATDAASVETMLRIVQSVPSPKAEPVRLWLAKVGTERLEEAIASRDEPERRTLIRGEVAEKNAILNTTAATAGVLSRRDFAIFHDHGYMGMYNGEKENDIHARKGLAPGERVLDWMGSEELAANLFRITQTEAKIRREGINTKDVANRTHYSMGKAVRTFILDQGGTPPEELPTPTEGIKELRRLEPKRIASERQPPLFDKPE
jgi:DNA-damage-inducible protein D